MTADQPPIRFYHTPWCPDCTRARRLLDEYGVAYDPINIATDAVAAGFVCSLNHGCRSVQTLVFPDGSGQSHLIEFRALR